MIQFFWSLVSFDWFHAVLTYWFPFNFLRLYKLWKRDHLFLSILFNWTFSILFHQLCCCFLFRWFQEWTFLIWKNCFSWFRNQLFIQIRILFLVCLLFSKYIWNQFFSSLTQWKLLNWCILGMRVFITAVQLIDWWQLLYKWWAMLTYFTPAIFCRLFIFLWCFGTRWISFLVEIVFSLCRDRLTIIWLVNHLLIFTSIWPHRILGLRYSFVCFVNNKPIILLNIPLKSRNFLTLIKLWGKGLTNLDVACVIVRLLVLQLLTTCFQFASATVENFMFLEFISKDIVNLLVHFS